LDQLPANNIWTELASFIIKNTEYVPFAKFKAALFRAFDLFKSRNKELYYIIVECNKYGSEFWLLHLLSPELFNDPNLIGLVTTANDISKLYEKCTNFLIIDDCIYTGSNVSNTIADFTRFKNHRNVNLNFHIVTAYLQDSGAENILIELDDVTQAFFYTPNILFSELMKNKYKKLFPKELNGLELKSKEFNIRMNKILDQCPLYINYGAYPIYFDHKIADAFSSFPSIYLEGGIFNQRNKMVDFLGPLMDTTPTREAIDYVKLLHLHLLNRDSESPC
jgi:hypothetical protein